MGDVSIPWKKKKGQKQKPQSEAENFKRLQFVQLASKKLIMVQQQIFVRCCKIFRTILVKGWGNKLWVQTVLSHIQWLIGWKWCMNILHLQITFSFGSNTYLIYICAILSLNLNFYCNVNAVSDSVWKRSLSE